MKYSRQRELILNTVLEHNVHPTADYVYSFLRKDNPNLSLGTVYRNLSLLAENGTIRKISIPNGSDRFDGCMHEHYHMVCERCGGVYDIELDGLHSLDERIEQETGFVVTGHELIVNGICNHCKSN